MVKDRGPFASHCWHRGVVAAPEEVEERVIGDEIRVEYDPDRFCMTGGA